MAGLFTLNDEVLGVLSSVPLGGFGTGVVVGSQSQSGSVAGSVGFAGSVAGAQVSSGSVTGRENNVGSVAGSQVSSGSVTGTADRLGSVSGVSVTAGSGVGVPAINGSVTGSSASNGAVTGVGPAPAPQPAESGGARWWYWPAPKIVRNGRTVSARSRGRGSVSGSVSVAGGLSGIQQAEAVIRGIAEIIIPVFVASANSRRRRQQAADDELLLMWVD